MLNWFRKPWLLVILMNAFLLQVVDQLNHWTSFGFLYLQPFWLLAIFPALYFPLSHGIVITFISALFAESYSGLPFGTLLFLLCLLHCVIFMFRKHLQNLNLLPHPSLILLTVAVGFFTLLPFTPLAQFWQPAFWFRFTADLGYNLIGFVILGPLFYRVQRYFLHWAEFKEVR